MTQVVEAIYESGTLKPLQSLHLAEGQKVRLAIEEAVTEDESPADEARAFERMSLAAMADLWDNEEDAVYDDWRVLYGVPKG